VSTGDIRDCCSEAWAARGPDRSTKTHTAKRSPSLSDLAEAAADSVTFTNDLAGSCWPQLQGYSAEAIENADATSAGWPRSQSQRPRSVRSVPGRRSRSSTG